ncbi:cytochrome c [Novosphingobium sp.]|uniref:c-type cytochrome n=1 Tax=Novosphingobium sp. TaxID=1874826 RepID=UPI0035B2A267
MKRVLLIGAIALLAACSKQQPAAHAADAGKGPPPPPYQMRPEFPGGNRMAATSDGKTLFEYHCGYCHLTGGMGTNLLTKQRMAAGEPPEMGLLANRKDLTPDYVKTVVRHGKNAMPPQTKVDLTDPELDAVALYLGKAK